MKGRFITFEGGEGVGKSTQSALLVEALRARGIDCIATREPGGTPGAEAIRALLLEGEGFAPRAEALLFAAARSDHVERLIGPALERGTWVICDRFLDSSRAYQGGAGAIGDERIMQLHAIGSDGLLPDRTLLFTLDPEESQQRLAARDKGVGDAIGSRGAAYHDDVARSFAALAASEPERFVTIDASGSPNEVHQRVLDALQPLLEADRSC